MARSSADLNQAISSLNLDNTDLSTLTDEELQNVLGLLQERQSTPYDLDSGDFKRQLDQKLSDMGVQPEIATLASPIISDYVSKNGSLPDNQTLQNLLTEGVFSKPSGHRTSDNGSILGRTGGGIGGAVTDSLTGFTGASIIGGSDLGRKLTTGQGGELAFNQIPGGIDPLLNFINDQDTKNYLSNIISNQKKGIYATSFQQPDYSTTLQSVQDLIGSRKDEANQNQSVTDFIGKLKGELSKGTEDYISSRRAAANADLTQNVLPSLAQNLNVRGLLFGGDLGAGATDAVAKSQVGLDSEYADLLNQDLSFYQNAAYQTTLKSALVKGSDYASQLQAAEASAMQDQAQRFSASESKLSSQSKLDLAQRDAQTQLAAQQKLLQAERDRENAQYQANLYGGIASSVGSIAGGSIGGTPGAIAGGQAGSLFKFS